jgi:GntR family transcriptional regulator
VTVKPLSSGRVLREVTQPRYLVLARSLAAEIRGGTLGVGDRLPGERELCRQFGLSRVTVRRALNVLQDDGLIESIGARGWFVTPNILGEPNLLRSFTDMAESRGLRATADTLTQSARPATLDEADTFAISPAADVFELKRLRRLDDVPVGIEHTRIPLALAPSLAKGEFNDRSLYQVLRASGIVPTRADYDLQSIAATAEEAELLDCQSDSPLLLVRASTYDQRGRPIELSSSVFRGDRYRFRATLHSSSPPSTGARSGPRKEKPK